MHGWKGLKVVPTQVWTRGTFKCHKRVRVCTKTSVHVGHIKKCFMECLKNLLLIQCLGVGWDKKSWRFHFPFFTISKLYKLHTSEQFCQEGFGLWSNVCSVER